MFLLETLAKLKNFQVRSSVQSIFNSALSWEKKKVVSFVVQRTGNTVSTECAGSSSRFHKKKNGSSWLCFYHNKYLTQNKEEECHTLLINSKYLTQTDFFFFF